MPRRDFSQRLRATPTEPGVYRMRDASENVLYVGKAASLRHRLSSYFAKRASLEPKIRRMVARVADFDFIITESESEALILECNLIKEPSRTDEWGTRPGRRGIWSGGASLGPARILPAPDSSSSQIWGRAG